MLGREPFLVPESFLLCLTYFLSSKTLDYKKQHHFASGLLLSKEGWGSSKLKQRKARSLEFPCPQWMPFPLGLWTNREKAVLPTHLSDLHLKGMLDQAVQGRQLTAVSTRGAVCMLFHWEVKQRRLHSPTMSNERWGVLQVQVSCCGQLGDLFFLLCIPSTNIKKDGQHYVVACENKHLHGFCATWWVCSMRGRQAYWIM